MKKALKNIKKKVTKRPGSTPEPAAGAGAAAGGPRGSMASLASGEAAGTSRRGSVVSMVAGAIKGPNRRPSTGSNVDQKPSSASKLHLAVWNEELDRVKKLVQKNDVSMINSADQRGRTPLHLAAAKGSSALVWPLLSHGASVHARDSDGATALHRAVQGEHTEVAQMLLDRGCPLDVADLSGDTVLHWATRTGNTELLSNLLRKGANPDLSNRQTEMPLHEAIRLGHLSAAQMLLRCGAAVNAKGPKGQTPLMMAAAERSRSSLVDTLLDYEADPSTTDARGWNAIRYARESGLSDIVDLLEHSLTALSSDLAPDLAAGATEDSFDDEEHTGQDRLNDNYLGIPLGLGHRDTAHSSMRSGNKPLPAEPASELSSWDSSSSDSPVPVLPGKGVSKMKHSAGIMDLSKFLNTNSEGEPEEKPNQQADGGKLEEENIYDMPAREDKLSVAPAQPVAAESSSDWGDSPYEDMLADNAEKKSKPPQRPPLVRLERSDTSDLELAPKPVSKVVTTQAKLSEREESSWRDSEEEKPPVHIVPQTKQDESSAWDSADAEKPPVAAPQPRSLKSSPKKPLTVTEGAPAQPKALIHELAAKQREIKAEEESSSWDDEGDKQDQRAKPASPSSETKKGEAEGAARESPAPAPPQTQQEEPQEPDKPLRREKGLRSSYTRRRKQRRGSRSSGSTLASARASLVGDSSSEEPEPDVDLKRRLSRSSSKLKRQEKDMQLQQIREAPKAEQQSPRKESKAIVPKEVLDMERKDLLQYVEKLLVSLQKEKERNNSNNVDTQKSLEEDNKKLKQELVHSSISVQQALGEKEELRKSMKEKTEECKTLLKRLEEDAALINDLNLKLDKEKTAKGQLEKELQESIAKKSTSPTKAADLLKLNNEVKDKEKELEELKTASHKNVTELQQEKKVHVKEISDLKNNLEKERSTILSMQRAAKLEEAEKTQKAKHMDNLREENKALKKETELLTLENKKNRASSIENSNSDRSNEILIIRNDLEAERQRSSSLERKLKTLDEEQKSKRKYLSTVEKQLSDAQKKLSTAEKKLNEYEGQVSDLEADLELLRKTGEKMSQSGDRNDAMRKEIHSLKQKEKDLQETIIDLKQLNSEQSDAIINLQHSVDNLQARIDRNSSSTSAITDRLRTEKERCEASLLEVGVRLEEALAERDALIHGSSKRDHMEASALNAEKKRSAKLEERLRILEARSKSLHEDLAEAEAQKEQSESKAADLTIEVKVLRQELADLKSSQSRHDQLNKAFKDKLQKDKGKLTEQTSELQRQTSDLKKRLETAESKRHEESTELKKALQKAQEEYRISQRDKAQIEVRVNAVQEEKDKDLTELNRQLNELKAENETLEASLENMKFSMSKSSGEKVYRLEQERIRVEKDHKKVVRERDQLQATVRDLEAKLDKASEIEQHHTDLAHNEMDRIQSEVRKLETKLLSKDKELSASREALKFHSDVKISEQRKLLHSKEHESQEVALRLRFSEDKLVTYEHHIAHLNERIGQLEEDLRKASEEKSDILKDLKLKEAEIDELSFKVVQELKSQLRKETQKLAKEQNNSERLQTKKLELEREIQRLHCELKESRTDLSSAGREKQNLREEVKSASEKLYNLEAKLEEEKRKATRNVSSIGSLEEEVAEERRRSKMAARRIAQLTEDLKVEITKRERAEDVLHRKGLDQFGTKRANELDHDHQDVVIESLEREIKELKAQISDLSQKLSKANLTIKALQAQSKRVQQYKAEIIQKEKIIEELEDRVSNSRSHEAAQFQRELRKFKLKYEILARNELNQKLSEVNRFLEEKAQETAKNERSREEVMEKIQKDLGDRLNASRDELATIKEQMRDTERGVRQLQQQLRNREQELSLEKNLRRQLEQRLGPEKVQQAIMDDYAKPYAYF